MIGMDANLVTFLFIAFVVVSTLLQLWLTRRQIHHVESHR
ncbi:MAG: hypothetical protein RL321_445, partial [Pseudomonadota bacterium]